MHFHNCELVTKCHVKQMAVEDLYYLLIFAITYRGVGGVGGFSTGAKFVSSHRQSVTRQSTDSPVPWSCRCSIAH